MRILPDSIHPKFAVLFVFILTLGVSSCVKSSDTAQQTPQKVVSALPVIKEAPTFHGTNALGGSFQSTQLKGSVWLAYFFFTSCTGPCPAMNARIQSLQTTFAGKNVHFAGVSVDPDTDTPDALRVYGKRYNADWSYWHMLRMPLDSVKSIAVQGFLLAQGAEDDPSLHSTRIVLVDKRGMIRGYFDGLDENEAVKLEKGIREVLAE